MTRALRGAYEGLKVGLAIVGGFAALGAVMLAILKASIMLVGFQYAPLIVAPALFVLGSTIIGALGEWDGE